MGLGIDMRIGIVARAVLNEDGKASADTGQSQGDMVED